MIEADKNIVKALVQLVSAQGEEERSTALAQVRELVVAEDIPSPVVNVERVVRDLILDIGIPDALKGYRYTIKAIYLLVENPNMIDSITGVLYPEVAKTFGTTPSRVERAIRHAVEVAIDRGDVEITGKYFGNTISIHKGKPTNGEFLARMANVVRDRMNGAA